MKVTEVTKRVVEAAPTKFIPTHFGGPMGMNSVMLHTDGNLYFQNQRQIVRWNGNPTGEGLLGRWNPATIKGRIVNGQKIPYGPGENFSNDPTAKPGGGASTWKDPDAQPTQAARPVTGASYDQGLLRKGSRGAGVKELQQKLGMPESEQDGIFGPKTEAAVRKLQQSQGIKVDGIVGPETRGAIEKLQAPEDNSAPEQTPPTKTDTPNMPDETDPNPPAPEEEPEAEPEEEPEAEPEEEPEAEPDTSANDNQSDADDAQGDPATYDDDEVESGVVTADTIMDRLSDDAKEQFQDELDGLNGNLLATLVKLKKEAQDAAFNNPKDRRMRGELFGITSTGTIGSTLGFGGREITDIPGKGIIDINTVPGNSPKKPRNAAYADAHQERVNNLLARIKYKKIDDMEESRIIQLAGVDMKKKLDEASISINGADSAEVAEILRMMTLAGADGAKVVGDDDINPKPMPMPKPGGCGMDKPEEPGMGDMIRMVSSEEEEVDEWANNAPGHEGDDEVMSLDAAIRNGNDLHRKKKSYPATAGGDNPMNTESLESELKSRLTQALAEKKAKPDYIDIDGDGDKEEPMKKAAKEKKSKGIQAMIDAGNKKADAEAKEGYKIGKFKKKHKKKARFM